MCPFRRGPGKGIGKGNSGPATARRGGRRVRRCGVCRGRDCAAADGHHWAAEAARFKRLWWDADQARLVALWLLVQVVAAGDVPLERAA